jgi:hypothetical protein
LVWLLHRLVWLNDVNVPAFGVNIAATAVCPVADDTDRDAEAVLVLELVATVPKDPTPI